MRKDPRIKAYITGFVLSLVFTAIPYYLVVTQVISGGWLLGIILSFAVFQMLVQIIFFLHLGRDPKMLWQLGFFAATVFAVLVVVVGSIIIISHLHRNMAPRDVTDKITNDEGVYAVGGQQVGTCPGSMGTTRLVEIKNGAVSPRHTDARLCDTIIVINADDKPHDIGFGRKGAAETYAGEAGSTIRPGRNMAIPLTVLGTHDFYDVAGEGVAGDFTVAP